MFKSKRNIVKLFESRKGHLDYRTKRDYVRNGIVIIPCRISDYSDIINPYSVKGYEALNTEFFDYIKTTVEVTPPECPLVLNIIENCLSQEEKKTIANIITDDFSYDLGLVEKKEKRHARSFCFMFVGLLISGVLMWLTRSLAEEPRELFFIPFWFMGETLCDYILLTGHELRQSRMLAGRLASIKVIFSKNYEAPNYTKSDFEKLYSEIESDVNKTIQDED